MTTTHTYYDLGDRWTTTDPRENTTLFTYDTYGNLETVTDNRGLSLPPPTGTIAACRLKRDRRPRDTRPPSNTTPLPGWSKPTTRWLPAKAEPAMERSIYDDINNRLTQIDAEEAADGDHLRPGRSGASRSITPRAAARTSSTTWRVTRELESTWYDATTGALRGPLRLRRRRAADPTHRAAWAGSPSTATTGWAMSPARP